MPVHVEKLTNEVVVFEGDLPLTESQIDRLVKIVLARLDEKRDEAARQREATVVRRQAAPTMQIGE